MKIHIYTIGYTQKSASEFFSTLHDNHVKKLLDIRLNNTSQLAGYTKKDDLNYFLSSICNISYFHIPDLAPTKEILDDFKKNKGAWSNYRESFLNVLSERQIEKKFNHEFFDQSCLLCSEKEPTFCHRSLVVEYLQEKWGDIIQVNHLGYK